MNTGLHEFGAPDNGQNADAAYYGPMTDGYIGRDSLLQILWRGRWLMVLSVLVALAAAYGYFRTRTPLYVSTSRILVEKPGTRPRYDLPQPAGSTSSNYLQTQASMITSREIIAATLMDPNVLTLPTFRGIDYPVEEVIRTLSATVGKNVDIISVQAESAYPEDAAQIVNAVVQAYTRWHEANRQVGTADLLRELNTQLERRYAELRTKRKERMVFEQRNPEVVENTRGGIVSTTLEVIKQKLADARLQTIQADSYYEGIKPLEDEPEKLRQYAQALAIAPDDRDERTLLEGELLRTQLQLQELADSDGMRLSHMKMLQNKEQTLSRKMAELDDEFVQKQVSLARHTSENAHALEAQLTDLYETEFAKVQSLSGQDSEYTFVISECDMLENLCNSLLAQINALDLSARLEGLNIRVLERALPAIEPSSPQIVTIMAIGAVLGLMAGAGLAFLRDWRDQRVRSADEITAILGVRVLGAVPSISRRQAAACGQILRFAPNSRESEAYRAIRTALFFGAPSEETATTLVTSPCRLEGKTTLVSNLGIAMAQAGQKTLIIDADLRKPIQHRVFSPNEPGLGLADLLMGTATLEEVIRHTEVDGMDVIAGGECVANPSELLGSHLFAGVLDRLKGRYDRILIDSPPVGAVTDAQILATLCGQTLLILRANSSRRIPTEQARDALLTVGANLAGVVVNDVSRRNNRYNHYSLYSLPYYGHPGSNGGKSTDKPAPQPPSSSNATDEDDERGAAQRTAKRPSRKDDGPSAAHTRD